MGTANSFIDYCMSFCGVKEGTNNHHVIVDAYNKITPLPRGYKAKYTDSWCAIFISAMAKMSDNLNQVTAECSAEKHRIKLAKKATVIEKKKDVQVGDIVYYDFDYNTTADHVGAVCEVQSDYFLVIEGNKSDAVGIRTVKYNNSPEVLQILRPKWTNTPTANKASGDVKTSEEVAKEVIKGLWGNGSARRQKLAAAGYDYNTIQILVNQLLKK